MQTMRNRLLMVALAAALSALLSGCLEIEEKVSIGATGASAMRFLFRIPIASQPGVKVDTNAREAAEKLTQELADLTDVGIREASAMGQTAVIVEAKASSLRDLAAFYVPLLKKGQEEGPDKASDLGNIFTPKSFYTIKRKGDRLFITRIFTPPKKKKAIKKEDKDLAELMGLMGSTFVRYELEIPGEVISSNAESVDGQRLLWVVPFEHLQENRVELRAEISAPPEVLAVFPR